MSLFGNVNQNDEMIDSGLLTLAKIGGVDLTTIMVTYNELINMLAKSEGDFVTALQVQMEKEKALVMQLSQITTALAQQIKNARSDFKSADQKYADSKIEK